MIKKILFTVDVEPDLHTGNYLGITEGIKKFERICDENGVKPILFVTCDCIKKYPKIFKKLNKKGWEISLHSYSHKRFDEMPFAEKEEDIKNSLKCFRKYLDIIPKGFRAPQHSIDNETLDLLEKYGFKYDSSYAPLNLLQLAFFLKKFKLWFKQFFSPLNLYQIRSNLLEIPTSSLIIPFVSFSLRLMPRIIIKPYVKLTKLFYKQPVFYAHSWDFIELKNSKIDRYCSHEKPLAKIEYIMKNEK